MTVTTSDTLNVREIAALLEIDKAEVYALFDSGRLTVLRRGSDDHRMGLLRARRCEVEALRSARQ